MLCEEAIKQKVPLNLVWSDDHLRTDSGVKLRILQPPTRGYSAVDDNANSIVLSLEFGGRRVLLTGDLEKSGLQALLHQQPIPHDILLAPHHGSLKANPADLARWAAPRWVVISGGGEAALAKLQDSYGDGVTLLSTADRGAVMFEISPEGEIAVTTQIEPQSPQ
jgi:competence protein ComEC